MAQLGRFGIALPIYNYRFNKPHIWATTITSIASKTITPGTFPGGSADRSDRLFGSTEVESIACDYAGKINRVILGPSTHSSNLGAVEELFVAYGNTGSLNIEVEDTPAYSYTSGDPLTMCGIGCPDGWYGAITGSSTKDFSNGTVIDVSLGSQISDGYVDPYGFNILNDTQDVDDAARLNIGKLMAEHYYRLEVHYKSDYASGTNDAVLVAEKGVTSLGSMNLVNTSGVWSTLSSVFNTDGYQSNDSFLVVGSKGITANLNISSISLTHAPYDDRTSNGGTVYNQDGVSTIDEYPLRGSVRVKRMHAGQKFEFLQRGRNQKIIVPNFSLPITRYSISYQLTDISSVNLGILEELVNWQDHGYLLNHFPGLVGLPHCLTGRIQLSGLRRGITDLVNDIDVRVVFTEVEL